MRSSRPDPGDPWPHDMVLTIDEPRRLTSLLFVREAWRLSIDDVPTIDAIPDVGSSTRPAPFDEPEVIARWRVEWARGSSMHAPEDRTIRAPDARTARLLRDLDDAALVDAIAGDRLIASSGIDHEAFEGWHATLHDRHRVPLAETPERVSVHALAAAWRRGLTSIVQLPFAGYFAERIHASTLVVSRTARHDPELYRRALAEPIDGTDPA
ncbi:hypothetical protein ABID70_002951 [Clavibacter michiganensis]|uniref:hypothetical protein n=1 Tax=Clavibacter michiganensis TaxID=28447 RepID=UPI001AE2913E|nr:hypothetical protein [Clavibacter michiganensis]MBP2457422.1 hypothetical protein [Clavibacter michiganensis]MDQ0409992.1 hypothetical protein [Clavibacter michiganensis]